VKQVPPSGRIFSELFLNAVIHNQSSQLYEFGSFVLNSAEHTLLRDGEPVPLRPKVFDTLLVLVERHSHLVEKDELISAIWPGQFIEEGNLNKTVSMLRQVLGKSADGIRYIETVPKRGYRFVADVKTLNRDAESELMFETRTRTSLVVEEETDDEPAAANGIAPVRDAIVLRPLSAASIRVSGKSEKRRKSRVVLVTAAVVIVLAAASYFFYSSRGGGKAVNSVAVLPFVNESGDPEVEYLSDGISESLINSLSQLPEVKVIARGSSFKYKGREVDPQGAARALGVDAILIGRVLRHGDQLRISVELVNARDKMQMWGAQYNREAKDLLAVQAEISRVVAGKLRSRLTEGEQNQLAKRQTVNPAAYELLLKGRFHLNKTTENQKQAIEYFDQAIGADPTYALAYADLSLSCSELININVLDPKEFMPKAEAAAYKALELDENLPEAHLAMAFVKFYAWEWAAAEREYKRALEVNPNHAKAHSGYMFYLTVQGRNDEALAEGKRARELDPLAPGIKTEKVYSLMLEGRGEEAIEAVKKLLEQDQSNPNLHNLLGYVYLKVRKYPECIGAHEQAVRLGDDSRDTQTFLTVAYAKNGETEKARAILKRLETGKQYVSPTNLALVYNALGERDRAFALLERAYSAHDQQLVWIGLEGKHDPVLRSDPRFQDLLRRVGLPDNRSVANEGK
jgi:TolB-like protein/DNA-binding winged helix-turn-helix (wHTH) protein/Tfp pilus assembly protein PilF